MGAWINIKHGDATVNATWTEDRYASELANFGECEAWARDYLATWLTDQSEDATQADVRWVRLALDHLTSAGHYPQQYGTGEARLVGPWLIEIGIDGYLADETTARLRATLGRKGQM